MRTGPRPAVQFGADGSLFLPGLPGIPCGIAFFADVPNVARRYMPEQIQLYRLFVAAPSDVDDAPEVIRGQIEQLNRDHGPLTHARVELTSWRTHSHPAAGARPQELLNKQVVDQCDILVGVFQSRFGTPTGVAASGTEEEIRRCIKQGKTVMVYFAHLPVPRQRKARDEFARIARFKRKFGNLALYHTYTDLAEFEKAFRQHLAAAMNDLLKKYVSR
jgi:hypothetical protein